MVVELQGLKARREPSATKRYPDHNTCFHRLLTAPSENQHLVQVVTQFHVPALRQQYFGLMDASVSEQPLDEREQIIFAVLDGDAARAQKLMRGQVRRTGRGIHRLSDDLFSQVYGPRNSRQGSS